MEYRAAHVVGAIDPMTLFGRLAPATLVDSKLRAELQALGVSRSNFAAFRVDVALSRRPRLLTGEERGRQLLPSSILLASDFEAVRRASIAVGYGEVPADLPIWIAAPSVIDRSLVPAGSEGEGLYVFVPAVPRQLSNGDSWNSHRQAIVHKVATTFEAIAPGSSQEIIGTAARSPEDIEATSAVYRGHAFHVDMCVSQLGPWRPTPSLAGYRSPIPGLWHTGAGAHPIGTVCGWPGRAAAKQLLQVA
jgi:phytoene dehydrogenase-like protein